MLWLLIPAALIAAALWALYAWIPGHRYQRETIGIRYHVITDHPLPQLLGSQGVVIGKRVLLAPGVAGQLSGHGLAHEVGHVGDVFWPRYMVDPGYRRAKEARADAFAVMHADDFAPTAALIRRTEARIVDA